jgi:hypothetical protein
MGGGGIGSSPGDSSGWGSGIEGRGSGGLEVIEGRDSGGRARPVSGLFSAVSGCNGCVAYLFELRQALQVLKTRLPWSAEALARKEESGSLFQQAEQYLRCRMEGSGGKIEGHDSGR